MRRSIAGAGIVLGLLLTVLLPGGAAAFPLSTCTLDATSTAGDGSALDTAVGDSEDSSQADPFIVDWNGTVAWEGTTGGVAMQDNQHHVEVFGFPTPFRGSSANGGDDREASGSVVVKESAPFRFTGLYYVSGSITGSGGSCEGSGWVKLTGDPIGTVPFFVGVGLLVVGLLLLGWGLGHPIAAILGGLIGGLGAATLLVIYSTLPLGSLTPVAVIVGGLILGILVAVLAVRRRAAPAAPATT